MVWLKVTIIKHYFNVMVVIDANVIDCDQVIKDKSKLCYFNIQYWAFFFKKYNYTKQNKYILH